MKKIAFFLFSLCFASLPLFAKHIKGGEVYYEYLGTDASGRDRFYITARLFLDCGSMSSQIDKTINIGIYRNADNSAVPGSPFTIDSIPSTVDHDVRLTTPSPCIVNPSDVCFKIIKYGGEVALPRTAKGYTVLFQRCCRIDNIVNLNPNNSVGASYTCQIHGYENLEAGEVNNNPQFQVKDTVLICQRRRFALDFGATDKDGDSLSYEFCSAYDGGSSNIPVVVNPGAPRSLNYVNYAAGFSGSQPLGAEVTVSPLTGLISGMAPTGGDYTVSVCLYEWRRGKLLSVHRKDFIVRVDANCDFAAADLNPQYITCDGFDFSFHNEAPFSTLIHTYNWDFGLPNRNDDTSTQATPTFVYPDTGTYTVKLYINKGEECTDSAVTSLKVYPGFKPGFTVNGSCRFNAFQFTDITSLRYGSVVRWSWDFGDEASNADTAIVSNPSWKYSSTGFKKVRLTVESSKGCLATIVKDSVEVRDKPLINLAFRDTLICSVDTLQLSAVGGGTFSWSPNRFILRSDSPNPLVFPKSTTSYYVTQSDNGCINTDSVKVRVVDFVTLIIGDTTICLNDSIVLRPNGNGLQFQWSSSAPSTLSNAAIKNPVVRPAATTTYHLSSQIGKCMADKDITVVTIPYPAAQAGSDQTICFGENVQLNGTITGTTFNWTPAATLTNPSSLTPFAAPRQTTAYILTVFDQQGCPKPRKDTVVITVRPPIIAQAGRDTSIVAGQPLQLSASGAEFFLWSPATGLSRTDIAAPTAVLYDNITYAVKVFNSSGCFSNDTVSIKVFKTNPDIFVPSAFTPAKSTNNVFRPIPVGISTLDLFQVFNRWGQLLYSNPNTETGWDGSFAGRPQSSGAYVWMVRGRDYTGKTVFKKGTVILIR